MRSQCYIAGGRCDFQDQGLVCLHPPDLSMAGPRFRGMAAPFTSGAALEGEQVDHRAEAMVRPPPHPTPV